MSVRGMPGVVAPTPATTAAPVAAPPAAAPAATAAPDPALRPLQPSQNTTTNLPRNHHHHNNTPGSGLGPQAGACTSLSATPEDWMALMPTLLRNCFAPGQAVS